MRTDMEWWTEVRRRVLTGELSKRGACREYDLGWHTLTKILAHAEPPGYRLSRPRKRPKLEPFLPIIHRILEEDGKQPPKQRHTAKRIFERLRDEHGYDGGETIVKDAVRAWRQSRREVFVPLSHPPGEAQVDFGEATVRLAGEPTKVALFVMTLPYSGAIFIQAFPRECTETFHEGHARAFSFFGGVPKRISYDNSAIAVTKVFPGRERMLTKEFLRLRSHYLFQEHFCLVRRANEKGHVERLLGFARRNFLVPVPDVTSLAVLNERLVVSCEKDLERRTRGKSSCKRDLLLDDRAAFLPLPKQRFEARRLVQASANSESLVRFDRNDYSVPVAYAHRRLTIVATVLEVRLIFEDRLVARHARCWEREKTCYDPVHYLALLERKPGGFDVARPLEEWSLPDCFGLLRRRLEAEDDRHGTRSYIRVLRLLEKFPLKELTAAVEQALAIDVTDAESIRTILDHRADEPVTVFSLDGRSHLARVHVPTTDVASYGVLLGGQAS
ncbi:Integrase core domain protein [Planctomycetes bacterium Pan216]|uniref:Integrase core domain protein n=1 Tax=Kolteria novifilia TaxID=2527975 RepID=A0A518AY40_9BACT|nr:Integrase core domain protein [Planctomycetes bacterium Pan216]